jgi:hypothetical protein
MRRRPVYRTTRIRSTRCKTPVASGCPSMRRGSYNQTTALSFTVQAVLRHVAFGGKAQPLGNASSPPHMRRPNNAGDMPGYAKERQPMRRPTQPKRVPPPPKRQPEACPYCGALVDVDVIGRWVDHGACDGSGRLVHRPYWNIVAGHRLSAPRVWRNPLVAHGYRGWVQIHTVSLTVRPFRLGVERAPGSH